MSNQVKISRPRLRVVVERDAELVEYVVQTDNRDAVQFDLMRTRKGWPDAEHAPMIWMTSCAYTALKRSGELADGVTVDAFLSTVCVDVEAVDNNGAPLKLHGDQDDDSEPTDADAVPSLSAAATG